MRSVPRSVVVLVVAVTFAAIVHAALGGAVAGGDVLYALLARRQPLLVAGALVLLLVRLFLFFVAPAWVLYIVTTLALARARR